MNFKNQAARLYPDAKAEYFFLAVCSYYTTITEKRLQDNAALQGLGFA